MSPSTLTLMEELIRHARGALSSLEKWVAKEKKNGDIPLSNHSTERLAQKDRLHA